MAADPQYGQRRRSMADPFPAWNPDVREFYVQSDETLVAASTNSFELLGYDPPRQCVGYVKGFGQDGLCGGFLEMTWALAIGGRVVQTFKPVGQVGTMLHPATMTWPYTGGQRISILVSTAGNAWTVAGMLHLIEKNLDNVVPERF